VKPRRDERTLVSSVDLAPTILRACGLAPEPAMPGLNLPDASRLARRKAIFGSIFVHTSIDIEKPSANLKYRWIVRGRWKLIEPYAPNASLPLWEGQAFTGWSQNAELYDVLADPAEKNNLAAGSPDLVRSLRRDLDAWWRP